MYKKPVVHFSCKTIAVLLFMFGYVGKVLADDHEAKAFDKVSNLLHVPTLLQFKSALRKVDLDVIG